MLVYQPKLYLAHQLDLRFVAAQACRSMVGCFPHGFAEPQMQHRFVIVYRAGSDPSFDWNYYMQQHLPLAVGTSLKHAAVTACDADRPLSDVPADRRGPFVAICEVYFKDHGAREDFRELFSGHADAQTVIADETNYTRSKPDFIGCDAKPIVTGGGIDTPNRLRWMLPSHVDAMNFQSDVVEPVARLAAESGWGVESATGSCGIPPGSTAQYSQLLNVWLAGRQELDRALDALREPIDRFIAAGGEFVAAERLQFDLALARQRVAQ
jgi:hypothetical protein